MKNLMKKNLLFVFALFIATSTMSFKLAEQRNVVDYWFAVDVDGDTIIGSTDAPSPVDDCNEENSSNLCKIRLNTSSAPATVTQANASNLVTGDAHRTP
ncbi:putative component of viral defense system (DUF524 family) [Arcicella rosea]